MFFFASTPPLIFGRPAVYALHTLLRGGQPHDDDDDSRAPQRAMHHRRGDSSSRSRRWASSFTWGLQVGVRVARSARWRRKPPSEPVPVRRRGHDAQGAVVVGGGRPRRPRGGERVPPPSPSALSPLDSLECSSNDVKAPPFFFRSFLLT